MCSLKGRARGKGGSTQQPKSDKAEQINEIVLLDDSDSGLKSKKYIHIHNNISGSSLLFYIIDNKDDYWIRQYSLFQSDREIITNGKQLNSSIINACQLLLSKQYTQIEGFEDTTNSITSNFTLKGNVFNGIQILHVGKFCGVLYIPSLIKYSFNITHM